MHPQGLSRKGVILLILMMFLFSSMLPSQREFDAPIVVAGENTVHGKSIAFECSNNISSGDWCTMTLFQTLKKIVMAMEIGRTMTRMGMEFQIILMKTTTTMAGLHGWSVQFSTEQSHDDCPGFGPVKITCTKICTIAICICPLSLPFKPL